MPQLVIESDRAKAIHLAMNEANAGDVVVVAGKGHETTQEIAGQKFPFDDRQVAVEAIKARIYVNQSGKS